MKKLISLALAMLLCVSAVAMAEPSKSTANMTSVLDVKSEAALPAGFIIAPITDDTATEEQAEQCKQMVQEIYEAAKAGSLLKYFGDLQDYAGESIDLQKVLGTDNPVVNEIMPLIVKNYDSACGKVTVTFKFATPYQQDEPVVAVIRVLDPATGKVTQVGLMGKGTGADGAVELEFPAEVMMAIQNGIATMAIVSK